MSALEVRKRREGRPADEPARRDFRYDPIDVNEIEGWAILRRFGHTLKQIAVDAGVSIRRVERCLRVFDESGGDRNALVLVAPIAA